jgi:hypothetical protein
VVYLIFEYLLMTTKLATRKVRQKLTSKFKIKLYLQRESKILTCLLIFAIKIMANFYSSP